MNVTKNQLKILNYIKHKKTVSYHNLTSKYGSISNLNKYISITDTRDEDEDGFPKGDIKPYESVSLTEEGVREVESNQWFNVQYVLTSILLPIAVGVSSSVITALFLSLFK